MSTTMQALERAIKTPAITGAESEIVGFGMRATRAQLSEIGAQYPERVLSLCAQHPRIAQRLPALRDAAELMKLLDSSFVG